MTVVEVPLTQSDVMVALSDEQVDVSVVVSETTTVEALALGQPGPGTQCYVSSAQPVDVPTPYLWVEIDGEDFTFWIEDGS